MKWIITRDNDQTQQTLGDMVVLDAMGKQVFNCVTLEPPWKNNQQGISCIPKGIYTVVHRSAAESTLCKYPHFHILDVPGRSYVLFHRLNFVRQSKACIGVGKSRAYIDSDKLLDITESEKTLTALVELAKNETSIELEIR